jgi:hypothetical protein
MARRAANHNANALPFCSFTHHHMLKRRLTPARDELARFSSSTIAARGDFHRTGRSHNARRGPGVVCCKSFASGNRRTALVSSDK